MSYELSRNDEAVAVWQEMLDAGLSVWVGRDQQTGTWCAQVKPKTQNLHETVHADDFPDVIHGAAVLARDRVREGLWP